MRFFGQFAISYKNQSAVSFCNCLQICTDRGSSPLSKPLISGNNKQSLSQKIWVLAKMGVMAMIFMAGLLPGASNQLFGATYTWQGANNASWALAANWTPNRTTPNVADILQFNTGTTLTITAVPTQTIGNFVMSNNTNITLQAAAGITLTIGNGPGTDLDVPIGSALTIGTNVSMTLAANATANITGTLTVNAGRTYNTNGNAVVTTVNGAIIAPGTVTCTTATKLLFNSGSSYTHARNGGTIPAATWDAASTCNVTGMVATSPGRLNQTFGHFSWNCPAQTGVVTTTGNIVVNGNFTLSAGTFTLSRDNANRTLTIGGNYSQTGGAFDFNDGSAALGTISTMYVAGNFSNTVNSTGNMTTSGSIGGSINGTIVFNGTTAQTVSFTNANAAQWIDYTINALSSVQLLSNLVLYDDGGSFNGNEIFTENGSLDVGTYTISDGSGLAGRTVFNLNSGATLITAHTGGINGSIPSANTTKTFSTTANYTFDGTSAQVTGASLTGANNFTINNNAGVTLSGAVGVSGTFTLTTGMLTTTPNLLSITNTASTAISGGSATSFINGPVKWSLPANLVSGSTYNFPVGKGTTYLPFSLVNPTTGAVAPTAQVEAFAANPGGTFDATLTSVSTTEYWSLATVGNFTNSSLSLSRPTAITPLDVIGGSTTAAGLYTSLDGTTGANGVSGSNAIGTNRFFKLAAKQSTITTITINGSPFCAGATVSVPFTYNPKINFAGATFTAQLSDALGSFGVPVALQSVASNGTGSQSINVTIPGGTAAGTGYRVRIVSTTPTITGTDNGTNITISSGVPAQPGVITGSTSPCANATGFTYSVPNVSGVTYTWTFPAGWSQTGGGTTNSITVTSGSSSGTIQIVPSNACGSGTAQTLAVAVVAGPAITVQPSTTPQSLCQNGTTTAFSVTASGTGLTYQWYKNTTSSNSGGILVAGATSTSYTPLSTATGTLYYYCVVSGTCAPVATSNVSGPVTVIVPQALIPVPASRCGTGTVSLSVTPSACLASTINWFVAATGGASLGSGTSYTTPSISATTTYYAQETFSGGLTALGAAFLGTNAFGLAFDLSEQIVLNSVQVNAQTAGNVTIQLQDNTGTPISTSASTAVVVGTNTVNLNWTIPAGTGYRLVRSAGTANLGTTNPLSSWPVGFNVGSITNSIEGGVANSTRYDYFYNWNISRVRVPVTATVGAPVVTGFSGSSCGPGIVALGASATGGTISWFTTSTGGSAVATGPTYSPNLSSTTTYYVESTDVACTSSPRVSVVASIITKPTITAGGNGAYCAGSTINLTSSGVGLTNRYWTGPNGFYSLLDNPVLTGATTAMTGTYTVIGSALSGVNLVTNGNFESGNVGFGSSYTVSADLVPEGRYAVVANPQTVHAGFTACPDHTTSTGLQMVVNGATVANVNIWSQTVNVVPNTDYQYTYWVQSVVASNPSQLQLYINGSPAGPVYTADLATCSWKQFTYNWNSGSSTSAYLSLVNQNTIAGGNDFAIDDIVFQPACTTADPAHATADPNISNGGGNAAYGVIYVTVSADPTAGAIGSNQTICSGLTPATLTSTTAGTGSGTITYEWQTNASGTYVTIPGATTATYSPPALTATTSYQRRTVTTNYGTICSSPYTTPVTITVNAAATATAGGPNTVCQSATPAPITLTGASVGGSATTGAWSIISGGGSLSDYSQNSNAVIPTITYTPASNFSGTVTLRLTTNNTGCAAVSDRTITVTALPVATFNYSGPYCSNASNPTPTFSGGGVAGTFSSTAGLNFVSTATGQINLSTSTAGTYTVTNTIAAAGGCSIITATSPVTINLDGSWNGSVSTDWNSPSNWDCNQLPTLTTNVLIAGSKPRYPTNSTGATDLSKDLTIQSGASVTVSGNTLRIAGAINKDPAGTFTATTGTIEMAGTVAQTIPASTFAGSTIMGLNINNPAGVTLGGALSITGIVNPISGTLNSGVANLTLISTATQTALISGTGSGSVIGTVNMQRYIASGFGYKYFSSPFSDATVAQFSGYLSATISIPKFYFYDENHKNPPVTGADISGWTNYPAGTLSPMVGYAANLGPNVTPKTITLTGTVNNGPYSLALNNNNRTYTQGFNLVGNPYPSPIDWNAMGWTKTNMDNSLYFFDSTGGTDEYSGSYSSYVNGVSTGGSNNIIPSMQGFFVHVSDVPLPYPVNGILGMSNSIRTNVLNPIFKEAYVDPRIILRFEACFDGKNSLNDAFVLYFDPTATTRFDKNADALKIMNTDDQVPNLYAFTTDNRQVSINGMPFPTDSITMIPLGITTYRDNWVSIKAKEIGQLPSVMNLYLTDKESNTNQDLKKNPVYRFYLKKGVYDQRFSLLLSTARRPLSQLEPDKLFVITRSGGKVLVKINLHTGETGKLTLYNLPGQKLLEKEISDQQTIDISSGVASGVYVITVKAGNRGYSEKTIIRKE